jgi:TRAP-type mannitol/chloroaromatic compound transport system permease small subunit
MPSISFDLPHWVYWASLLLFPLIAMALARRGRTTGYSLPIAYFILATGGMMGLHRFYLKNIWGLLYLPLFLGILWVNAEGRTAREAQSEAANLVRIAERTAERERPRVEGADERLAELRARLEAAEPGSFSERSAERALEREEETVARATERLAAAEADLEAAGPALTAAQAVRMRWTQTGLWLLYAILAFMVVDALLLPTLRRRAEERADLEPEDERLAAIAAAEEKEAEDDRRHIGQGWTGAIDRLSYYAGEFVSYWAVIAVIVYYYEVVARYVFNSPTNWAHEGMYLMFGMQYLIAGAFAMLTDAHVKVDVFYANWSPMRKALVDLFTSIFFFLFAGTLLVTGWIFAFQATGINELSFSEWQIAYWPFKWALAIGGLLLVLQGVAKFARDIDQVRLAASSRSRGA